MKISYNANFKFELMSKRAFYSEYQIEYIQKDKNCIAFLIGKGEKRIKKVVYKDYELLEDSIQLGKYIKKANIKDVTTINKITVDKKVIRDDRKNQNEYLIIKGEIIKYISKYGLSISKEDNELNSIIGKVYMLDTIKNEWKSKIGLVEDMTYKDKQTLKKFNTSLEALSARLNGNMLSNPVKNVLLYNEDLHTLEISFYCTSVTSIATQQLMIFIANKNHIYIICKYCKEVIDCYDKRVKCCDKEKCKNEANKEKMKKYREKNSIVKKLEKDIINILKDKENLKNYTIEKNKYTELVSKKKIKKEEYIEWLTEYKEKVLNNIKQ